MEQGPQEPSFCTREELRSSLSWIYCRLFKNYNGKRQRYFASCCVCLGEVRSQNANNHPLDKLVIFPANKEVAFDDIFDIVSSATFINDGLVLRPRLNIEHSGYAECLRKVAELKSELESQHKAHMMLLEITRKLSNRVRELEDN